MSKHQKFLGSGHWVNRLPEFLPGVGSLVNRYYADQIVGILHDDSKLALDFKFGVKHYTVELTCQADGVFSGGFVAHENGHSWKGAVAGRLFYGVNGILFHGAWVEDPSSGVKDTFWLDLLPEHAAEDASHQRSRFIDHGLEFISVVPSPDDTKSPPL